MGYDYQLFIGYSILVGLDFIEGLANEIDYYMEDFEEKHNILFHNCDGEVVMFFNGIQYFNKQTEWFCELSESNFCKEKAISTFKKFKGFLKLNENLLKLDMGSDDIEITFRVSINDPQKNNPCPYE